MTPAKSSLVQDFFQTLCNKSDKSGNILFPECLLYFGGQSGRAEKTIQVKERLQLKWHNERKTLQWPAMLTPLNLVLISVLLMIVCVHLKQMLIGEETISVEI